MLLSTALVFGLTFWGSSADEERDSVTVAPNGATFAAWSDEGGDADCRWWDGHVQYDTGLCSAFSVTRVSSATIATAVDRANRCASAGTTECVLNGEIGLALPSVFIYDTDLASMRMLIAPRLLALDDSPTSRRPKIKLVDPAGEHANQIFEFNETIKIEYLRTGGRTMAEETLHGASAYCVQALRRSIPETCWSGLD